MSTKMPTKGKNPAKSVEQKAARVKDTESRLMQLAHAGTEEAVDRLREFIQKEKNESLCDYAQIALEEAEFNYYSPESDQEEEDFLLARSIWRRQENLWRLEGKADAARLELKELDLDRKVHQKIIESLIDKEKINDWQHNFSEDYYIMIQNKLAKFEAEIAYEDAWLKQACQLIKIEKYRKIPPHIFDHIHFDADACSIWEDETESTKPNPEPVGGLINYIDNPK